jgi:hypothetical protein
MLAAAAALRDDPVVQKLIATVSAAAPSSDESVQTMEALLQNPLVYGLVTSAGLEWCQRDVDETAESAVVQCWQHHAARSLTFRQGSALAGKTRVSGYVGADVSRSVDGTSEPMCGRESVSESPLLHSPRIQFADSFVLVVCACVRKTVWNGLKTVAFVPNDRDDVGALVYPDGFTFDVKPDLLVTASSSDWQADDPLALLIAAMQYKAVDANAVQGKYDRET